MTRPISHEELFIDRYDQLLRWALKIARQDSQLAEDLVHDAFIQFTHSRPDLRRIHNIEGYLYRTLRNRHLSNVRRNWSNQFEGLSVIEYDSARAGLRRTDRNAQIQARDDLSSICEYAITRRGSSKTASVLILRFFHDYLPSEIAVIIKATRAAVDVWLRLARKEARLYLDEPGSLKFITKGANGANGEHTRQFTAPAAEDFLQQLQLQIFAAREGTCLSETELERLYSDDTENGIGTIALAHIVSCHECLEVICSFIGLSPPSSGCAADSIGPASVSRNDDLLTRSLRRCQRSSAEAFEHSPSKLFVSVNGFVAGSQSIGSRFSELTLTSRIDEKIEFVEVFSEKGTLLLAVDVQAPPDGEVEQSFSANLSDNRLLRLDVSFTSAWPTVGVSYEDPLYETAEIDANYTDVNAQIESKAPRFAFANRPSGWAWLLRLWLRPGFAVSALAVLLVAATLLVHTRKPTVRAADLLKQAVASDTRPQTGFMQHRVLELQTRELERPDIVHTQTIEVWETATAVRGIKKARRVYDERGHITVGEWVADSGMRTVYDHGTTRFEAAPADPKVLLTVESAWRLEPSAAIFSSLVGQVQEALVDAQPAAYTINYQSAQQPDQSDRLVRATLTLNRSDLHAVEQMLVFERDRKQIEYRFVERRAERLPLDSVSPSVLEPGALDPTKRTSIIQSGVTTGSAFSKKPTSVASADLEIELAYLLNSAGANTGEQISLSRTSSGRLVVRGIVDTDQRKREILGALRSVNNNPAVQIDIATIAEASRRRNRKLPISLQQVEVDEMSSVPAYAQLRDYLSRRGESADRIEQGVREFSDKVLTVSRSALRHAWALRRISDQVRPEDTNSLGNEARAKRLAIIREHAAAFQQEAARLRSELEPIFGGGSDVKSEPDEFDLRNDSDVSKAIARLAELASVIDADVLAAFTVSSTAGPPAIKTLRFWQSLRSASALAARITDRAGPDQRRQGVTK